MPDAGIAGRVRVEDDARLVLNDEKQLIMAGGGRYPYPKHVWSPAGGWWTRPANWKSNTAVTFAGMCAIVYGVWSVSAEKEVRTVQPDRWIPSMMWAKQYTEKKDSN